MPLEMKPVASSQVRAAGYDPETRVLRIQFQAGATYDYSGVPPDIYEDLLKAESFGRFHAANIKGKFDYERLPDEAPTSDEPR